MAKVQATEKDLKRYEQAFLYGDKDSNKKPHVWQGPWYDTSSPHTTKNNAKDYTWYRFRFPLDGEKKDLLLHTYPQYKSESEFDNLNRTLVHGLSVSIKVQNMLDEDSSQNYLQSKVWIYNSKDTTHLYIIVNHQIEPAALQLSEDSLSVSRAVGIMRTTMDILQDVANRGYAHRNVNPYAICIEKETDKIFLSDFLFAAKANQDTYVTPCIDCNFTSPEVQAGGYGGIGGDMYSVALMLFALFTGQSVLAPINKQKSIPQGVPTQIQRAIELGLTGLKENVSAFCSALDALQTDCPVQWDMPIVALLNSAEEPATNPTTEPDEEPTQKFANPSEDASVFTSIPPVWKRSGSADAPASESPSSANASRPNTDIDALLNEVLNYDANSVFMGDTQPGGVPEDRQLTLINSDNMISPKEIQQMQNQIRHTQRLTYILAAIILCLLLGVIGGVGYGIISNNANVDDIISTFTNSSSVSDVNDNSVVSNENTAASISNATSSEGATSSTENTEAESTEIADDTVADQQSQEASVVLDAPTNVVFLVEAAGIAMQWDAVDGATGYELQISDVTSFDSDNTQLVESETNLYAVADTGWDSICVRVRAYTQDDAGNKTQVSEWSDISRVELDG